MADPRQTGERIAYHRKRLGLSQVELGGLVDRSESWVSQVERGIRPLDRMSVLQRVADALSVSVAELRGDEGEEPEEDDRPEAFETIRLALTGHPAVGTVLGTIKPAPDSHLATYRRQHAGVWELVHASRYTDLAPVLAVLIPGLESAARTAASNDDRTQARELLADTYQAAAAMLSKIGEMDAAWIAADRAGYAAEAAGSPLGLAAAMFRMAHVFLASAGSTRPSTSPRPWQPPSNLPSRRKPTRPCSRCTAVPT